MTLILIDSGQSEMGWSKWGTFYACPMQYALKYPLGQQDTSEATTRGTMGHVGLAHLLTRYLCQQQGWDFDNTYFQPEEAIREWARQNPHGLPFVDQMIGGLRAYCAKNPTAPGEILSVETQYFAILGTKNGAWGLWVVSEGALKSWMWGEIDGVTPTCLDMPGHPRHGRPIFISKRIDLVLREPDRRVWAWDHKWKARVTKSTVFEYLMDGQFAVTRLMMGQVYGAALGGTRLNLCQSAPPHENLKPVVPGTQHRDRLFARTLYQRAHELARLERDVDPREWPMTQHELVCRHRYGPCIGMEADRQPGFCATGELK